MHQKFNNQLYVLPTPYLCVLYLSEDRNEYIRKKNDAPDTVLDDVTRKHLITYGHVDRMKPTQLAITMIDRKPSGWRKVVVPEEHGKTGYIQRWVEEIWDWANGTIEGNGVWKSEGVVRRCKIALYICIYLFIYLRTNSDLCHLQHKLTGFYNRDEKCLLRGTNWVFK